MAASTEGDQIFCRIVSQPTAKSPVMDPQVFKRPAQLTTPSISLQHLFTGCLIIFRVQPPARLPLTQLVHPLSHQSGGNSLVPPQPHGRGVHQGAFLLSHGYSGSVNLRAELEIRPGVFCPVARACEQPMNHDGSITIKLRTYYDPDWRKGVQTGRAGMRARAFVKLPLDSTSLAMT